MNRQGQQHALESERISRQDRSRTMVFRIAAAVLAFLPLALLGTASQLTPNPIGLGTHQQLGLPPCTMRALSGIRCPGCGMTTSWAHFMNGHWKKSAAANLGGFLLAIYSLGFAAIAMKAAVSGRLPSNDIQRILATTLLAIAALTLATWGWSFLA